MQYGTAFLRVLGGMRMKKPLGTEARRAANAVVADLCDRRGLSQQWADIDSRTRREIRDAWARLIERSYQRSKGTEKSSTCGFSGLRDPPPAPDPRQCELFPEQIRQSNSL